MRLVLQERLRDDAPAFWSAFAERAPTDQERADVQRMADDQWPYLCVVEWKLHR